jgi:hypothetical protein
MGSCGRWLVLHRGTSIRFPGYTNISGNVACMKNGATRVPFQSIIPIEFFLVTPRTFQRAISGCRRQLDLGDHLGEFVEDIQVVFCSVERWTAVTRSS